MDTLVELLAQLRRQDVKLWVDGSELRVSAPPGVLTPERVDLLRARKPELIAFLLELGGGGAGDAPVRVRRDAPLPATFGQEQLWLLDRLGYRTVYHMPLAFELCGPLDSAALAGALGDIVQRHEGLRTGFAQSPDGQLLQVVAPPGPVAVAIRDLAALDPRDREAALAAALDAELDRPFDLARGPLLRALAIRMGAERQVLLLILHHIVGDGWSVGVLLRELSALYAARATDVPAALPELPVQLADVACWQRRRLAGDALERALGFWRERLAGAPTLLDLPGAADPGSHPNSEPGSEPDSEPGGTRGPGSDRPVQPRPVQPRGARLDLRIDTATARGLRALGRDQGATLFMILLAAFQVLLGRFSGQDDLLVGTPVAGRVHPALEPLIGYFVNTLVLRAQLGDVGFSDLLARVRQDTLAAYEHQDLPFEQVVEALNVERIPGRNPLVQVLFTFQNATRLELALPGVEARQLELPTRAARMDLEVDILEDGEDLASVWVYDRDRYARADIERLAVGYQTLLAAIVAAPGQRVGVLPLLPDERRRLLVNWNATAADLPETDGVHRLFESQAERTPTANALVYDGRGGTVSLTYGALNASANRLAHRLIGLGAGPGRLVGLCVDRSHWGVVGMLAALKAGAAWCPLDPDLPAERLAFLLADTGAALVLTQAHLAGRLSDLVGSAGNGPAAPRMVILDGEEAADARYPIHHPGSAPDPDGLAYAIYTSGSTGEPKGVLVDHRALLAHAVAYVQRHKLGAADRVLALAALHFDASVEQIFPALIAGGCVVVPDWELEPVEFSRKLAQTGVTLLDTSGYHWRALVDEWLRTPALTEALSLTRVVVGGDVMPGDTVAQWRRTALARRARLFNVYGPTETTVAATLYEVTEDFDPHWPRVPIGRPLANRTVYVLDHRREPVPIGVPGELYIGGSGVAQGYLNRPELTRERFLPVAELPFVAELPASAQAGRVYRSGDRCLWLPDGNLDFLGRSDDQVKIRGYRVELGEIEAQLRRHPGVRDAAVIVHELGPHRSLVAYVVPAGLSRAGELDPDAMGALADALAQALRRTLPEHMVPARFIALAEIPRALGASGKVDRGALPDPAPADGGAAPVAPSTPIQAQVLAVFAEVLKRPQVGIFDNFFELGGHSLLATRLIARVNWTFDLDLALPAVFEHPTPAVLAAAIERRLLSRGLLAPRLGGGAGAATVDEVGEL